LYAERVSDWYKQYLEYLASDEWQAQKEFFKKDCHRLRILRDIYGQDRCEICHTDAPTDVHHLHYVTLGHESYENLLWICDSCHMDINHLAKEKKVSMAGATFIMYQAYEPVRYAKLQEKR
jgi:hypothetical protein